MNRIILTADTPCDIGTELQQRYDVHLFPLHIKLGDTSYTDGKDIFPEDIYKAWRETKQLPKTAAINPGEYIDFFRPFVDNGDEVIHIGLGSGISSSFQNSVIAAEECGHVHCIDSKNLSTGFGHLVCEAGERIAKGMAAEQIVAEINALVPHIRTSFVLDTLEFMHAGGRCSSFASFGAAVMNIKPSLNVDIAQCGKMTVGKKYSGNLEKVLTKYITDQISGRDDIVTDRVFLTHSGMTDPDMLGRLKEIVLSMQPFSEVHITTASCTVSSHCGPNCLGILYIAK